VTVKLDRPRLVVVNPTAKDAETVARTALVNYLKLAQADGEGESDRGTRLVGDDVVLQRKGCCKQPIMLVDGTNHTPCPSMPIPAWDTQRQRKDVSTMDTPREGG
jgi:hypothetical protein